MSDAVLHLGDCLDVLKTLKSGSAEARAAYPLFAEQS